MNKPLTEKRFREILAEQKTMELKAMAESMVHIKSYNISNTAKRILMWLDAEKAKKI